MSCINRLLHRLGSYAHAHLRPSIPLRTVPAVATAAVLAACASIGRPEGGPRDIDPPVFVTSNPQPGELNVNKNRIRITFDENVNIKDIMTKVVVSPAQKEMPTISAVGRNVTVTLMDTLVDSTTYTIDFSDAISDLNEGNILDGFSFAFSTGPTIDTLSISGMFFDARTLEPAQGMMVGIYSNLSDTAITTLPFERLTKTNQLGQFTIRNIKEGTYRVYAVNDKNRDYHWDRSEDIAFYDVTVSPTTERYMRSDTIHTEEGVDSVSVVEATRFLPNDILLTWFNMDYKPQYLAKYERPERNRIYLEMGAKADSLPRMRIIGGPADGRTDDTWAILNATATRDTLDYWISDTIVASLDSLLIETRYRRTDSLDQLSWQTDTLKFNLRGNARKKQNKEEEKQKKGKNDEEDDSASTPKIEYLGITIGAGDNQTLNKPLPITINEPPSKFDVSAFELSVMPKKDSVWSKVDDWRIYRPDSMRPMEWILETEWLPEASYVLRADPGAVAGIYGTPTDTIKKEFTTRALDEYSSITFNIEGLNGRNAIVELLSTSDSPVAKAAVNPDGSAELAYLEPGKYYARLFVDSNDNGVYDIGIVDSIQPEETAYFPKRINLKKNWDVEQTWDIYAVALDQQKPNEIKKNKPKLKPGEIHERQDDEDEDEDDFGNPFGGRTTGTGGFGSSIGRGGRVNPKPNNGAYIPSNVRR